MFMLTTRTKKTIAIGTTLFAMSLLTLTPAKAAKSESSSEKTKISKKREQGADETKTEFYLRLITVYTRGSMTALNSWLLPDESETSINMKTGFKTASDYVAANTKKQNEEQPILTAGLLTPAPDVFTPPYINDFTYQSILDKSKPIDTSDERLKNDPNLDLPLNYIKNAAGLNFHHVAPDKTWTKGGNKALNTYKNFYTTVSSIQSYNGYILSGLYADAVMGNQLTTQQNDLMDKASSDDWFAQVAGESAGIVLRQILMYDSQIFVLLTQILQTQKQALAAQAMSNTLLVLGNRFTESQLYFNASGEQL